MFKKFGRKQNEKRDRVFPIQTVFDPGYLYKASGSLSSTPGIRHTILCSSISESMRETLLAEGFRAIGGETKITHTIFCTFTLPTAPTNPRCLFNLYLDCSSYPFPWADWAAKQLTASKRLGGLRRSLQNASPRFLIRCKNSHEYPFCLDDDTVDKYWLMDAEVYMRAVDRLYQKTKL